MAPIGLFRTLLRPEFRVCGNPSPWSRCVRLLSVKNDTARRFQEDETPRGDWTVKQLDRQFDSLCYERTALSRNKKAMLTKGAKLRPEDAATPEEEIKDPFVLEFLGLASMGYFLGGIDALAYRHHPATRHQTMLLWHLTL